MNKPMNHIWKMPNSCCTSILMGLRVLLYLFQGYGDGEEPGFKRGIISCNESATFEMSKWSCRSQYPMHIFWLPNIVQREPDSVSPLPNNAV